MKKRTSRVSRRIVSLLMSLVLTLTLVTPAAFAEGDMPDNGQQQEQQVPTDAGTGGSGTPIVEGGAGTTGTTPSGDAGNGGSGDVSTPADDRDTEDKGTEATSPVRIRRAKKTPMGITRTRRTPRSRPMRSIRWRGKAKTRSMRSLSGTARLISTGLRTQKKVPELRKSPIKSALLSNWQVWHS